MAYTEFHFEKEAVLARLAECRQALEARGEKLETFGAKKLREHLTRHGLARYLDFGPYWPALKDIFIAQGLWNGAPCADRDVAKAYCGETPEETIVMAEMFRDFYCGHYFIGTSTFVLDGNSGEEWRLYDPEVEALVGGESLDYD